MEEVVLKEVGEFNEFISRMDSALNIIKRHLNNNRKIICHERYLTNEDMAKIFHISKRTLQEYRDKRIIPFTTIGSKILYPESEIALLLLANYQPAIYNVKY